METGLHIISQSKQGHNKAICQFKGIQGHSMHEIILAQGRTTDKIGLNCVKIGYVIPCMWEYHYDKIQKGRRPYHAQDNKNR
jgi:hypothetical protein